MAQEAEPKEPQEPTDPKEPTEPNGEGGAQGEDWEAKYREALKHSREWEKKAKANLTDAKAYRDSQTKQKSVEERLAALESENAALKASAERAKAVKEAAKAAGVPEAIVATLSGEDAEALIEQANAIAAVMKPKGGAPAAAEAGKLDNGTPKPTKKSIMGIKDTKERLRQIAMHPELFKNKN